MKRFLIFITPVRVRNLIRQIRRDVAGYATKSYAQEGEDLILRRLLEGRGAGFYVDVGAHNPKRFSNTYLFYRAGWSGLNIDALPGTKRLFDRVRPRDTNVEAALSCDGRDLKFRIFNEPAVNTLKDENAKWAIEQGYQLLEEKTVGTLTLCSLLEQHLPSGKTIDFLSVDVEGMDLEVLQGNDWARFRPTLILVEAFGVSLSRVGEDPIHGFLTALGYELHAKTVNTSIYTNAGPHASGSSGIATKAGEPK